MLSEGAADGEGVPMLSEGAADGEGVPMLSEGGADGEGLGSGEGVPCDRRCLESHAEVMNAVKLRQRDSENGGRDIQSMEAERVRVRRQRYSEY